MSAELTIVIPTYNNAQGAIDLVKDFYRMYDPEMFRIISIDQTVDGIKFENPIHLHIKPYRNLGFSKAMNVGLKLSQTKYTLLANDDVRLLDKRWYEDIKKCLDHEDVLAVNPFPALRTWDGGGNPVWYWQKNEKFLWTKDKPYESYTPEEYDRLLKELCGGNGNGTTMFFTLIKTEARDIIGYLDEAYWCGGEDYDWNRRCFIKGYKILTCQHSLVHHESSVSKQNAVKAKEAIGYELVSKNKNIFNAKWKSEDCTNPDIYGKSGSIEPNLPWYIEQPL